MRSKERALERTQEVLGEISDDAGRTYRQIFVQDYTFSPRGATFNVKSNVSIASRSIISV